MIPTHPSRRWRRARIFVWPLLTILFFAACAPSPESVAATVESQAAVAAAGTIAALPSPSPEPTLTPNPTYTPAPTGTAVPTYTPRPTLTPNPTYTPPPTATPTDTPEPTPTATATRVPPTRPPATATSPPATNPPPQSAFTLHAVTLTQNQMETATGILLPRFIDQGFGNYERDWEIDCPAFLAANDRVNANAVPAAGSSDAAIQHAFTLYQLALDSYRQLVQPWVEECSNVVATGAPNPDMDRQGRGVIVLGMTPIVDLLQQVKHALE